MVNDIRHAFRAFRRRPSFALAAIATLTLGIAVNTVVFSLLNALALRPMPVPSASRVMRVYPVDADGRRGNLFSYADYLDYRSGVTAFDTLAAYIPADVTAGRSSLDRGTAEPRQALGYVVSANYMDLTGILPMLGRALNDQDERDGARAAVISHPFWQSRFNRDPAVIGATLVVNGSACSIVGVASPGFHGTEPLAADLWLSIASLPVAVPDGPTLTDRHGAGLLVLGRLARGALQERAVTDLGVVARRLRAEYPGRSRPAGVTVARGTFFTLDPGIRPVIAGILTTVALVLLIACANVANLLIARAAARRREIAVRLAIGASRWRISRQLITEALMLSVAAGFAALPVSAWTLKILYSVGVPFAPVSWAIALDLEPDVRVFAYTLAIASLGGIVLGLAPALQTASPDLVRALHDEGATSGGRFRMSQLRHALVILQLAVSLVLLLAAGLLLRGLQSAKQLDLGFSPAGVLYADYDLRRVSYSETRARAFNDALAARASSASSVDAVGFTSHVPLHGGVRRTLVRVDAAPSVEAATTILSSVSPEYFSILRMPIVTGRNFARGDGQSTAIISDGLARRFWPGESAVGKVLHASAWTSPRLVIGVVHDASNAAIWRDKEMAVYVPIDSSTDPRDVHLIARTRVDPAIAAGPIKAYAASLDGNLRFEATPLEALLRLWLLPSRAAAGGAAALALMALVLASIGVYGVLSFAVGQRMREIGIRMALGADAPAVVSLVLRDGWRLVWRGLAIGAVCALATAPLLGRLLFDVSALDPVTLIAVPLLLAGVALVACYVPARRASRVDPLTVLRID